MSIQSVHVTLDGKRDYDILVGENAASEIGRVLKENNAGSQCVIITNTNLKSLYAEKIQALLANSYTVTILDIPSGEEEKNLTQVSQLLDQVLSLKLERKDSIIAIGGGVIGDMAGFVASIYLRGINLIQVPTTLLAQVDAAIGGKTGVNHSKGKNLIGAFYQPKAVIIDPNALATLPKRELLCGLAEVVKYGVIRNPDLFSVLEKNAEEIRECAPQKNLPLWHQLILASAKDKAEVVSKDEREAGLRETLNYGHTIGHGIEAATGYSKYLHGEAVALGMLAANHIAVKKGLLSAADSNKISTLINHIGFKNTLEDASVSDILSAMTLDKKVRNGKLRFVLPTHIGNTITVDDIIEDDIKDAIQSIMIKE